MRTPALNTKRPQPITDFLKWKNRLAEYNGGQLPEGIAAPSDEANPHLVV